MLTHVLTPLPLPTAASVLSQTKQNHSICFFREWLLHCLERSFPGGRVEDPQASSLPQWCLHVEEGIAYLPFQKVRKVWQQVLPFSVLPWPQRDLSCCGPGGCRVLTRKNPEGSWAARPQATSSSRSCRRLDTSQADQETYGTLAPSRRCFSTSLHQGLTLGFPLRG